MNPGNKLFSLSEVKMQVVIFCDPGCYHVRDCLYKMLKAYSQLVVSYIIDNL